MQYSVRFSKKDPARFFRTLQQRVNDYFQENKIPKTGNFKIYLKTAAMLAAFFLPYSLVLAGMVTGWLIVAAYFVMGLAVAGIGLGIMHDANHGSYSRFAWVNNLLSYTMNLVGGSSFTWRIQHNLLHHSYTNIYHLDEDIHDKPFLRLSPHGKWRFYHRFQHYYAFFLYSLATFSWVVLKDFKQLAQYNKTGLTRKSGFHPTREVVVMIASKTLYFGYIIALPILFGADWLPVVIGFILLHLVAGFVITIIFQLAHVVEGPEQLTAVECEQVENTWAIHQLYSTANFSNRNKLLTWFSGGLNYQIEHHLFPSICHVHYPKIAAIVKRTVQEFDLPYYEFPRFRHALISHLKMLKSFGQQPVLG